MSTVNDDHTPADSTAGPVTAATERLLATAEHLDSSALARPSRCPGWSRGHVLTHVARNADALANLLSWAATGAERFMYPDAESRNAAIDAGARRAVDDILDDLRTSAARFSGGVVDMPDDGWLSEVRIGPGGTGRTIPARRLLWTRLIEVEVHHVDLDHTYTPQDWPDTFVRRALTETVRDLTAADSAPSVTLHHDDGVERIGDGGGSTVRGERSALLAWLIGRSSGAGLVVESGELPTLPAWK